MKTFSSFVKETNPGNYVSVDVTGLPLTLVSMLPGQINDKPHITLMYSKESAVPLDHINYVLRRNKLLGQQLMVTGVSVFDSPPKDGERPDGLGSIVLNVDSQILTDIHEHLLRLGCKHSYVPFKAHATLIYNCPIEHCHLAVRDIQRVINEDGIFLTCTKYNNENIDEDWVSKLNTG